MCVSGFPTRPGFLPKPITVKYAGILGKFDAKCTIHIRYQCISQMLQMLPLVGTSSHARPYSTIEAEQALSLGKELDPYQPVVPAAKLHEKHGMLCQLNT